MAWGRKGGGDDEGLEEERGGRRWLGVTQNKTTTEKEPKKRIPRIVSFVCWRWGYVYHGHLARDSVRVLDSFWSLCICINSVGGHCWVLSSCLLPRDALETTTGGWCSLVACTNRRPPPAPLLLHGNSKNNKKGCNVRVFFVSSLYPTFFILICTHAHFLASLFFCFFRMEEGRLRCCCCSLGCRPSVLFPPSLPSSFEFPPKSRRRRRHDGTHLKENLNQKKSHRL